MGTWWSNKWGVLKTDNQRDSLIKTDDYYGLPVFSFDGVYDNILYPTGFGCSYNWQKIANKYVAYYYADDYDMKQNSVNLKPARQEYINSIGRSVYNLIYWGNYDFKLINKDTFVSIANKRIDLVWNIQYQLYSYPLNGLSIIDFSKQILYTKRIEHICLTNNPFKLIHFIANDSICYPKNNFRPFISMKKNKYNLDVDYKFDTLPYKENRSDRRQNLQTIEINSCFIYDYFSSELDTPFQQLNKENGYIQYAKDERGPFINVVKFDKWKEVEHFVGGMVGVNSSEFSHRSFDVGTGFQYFDVKKNSKGQAIKIEYYKYNQGYSKRNHNYIYTFEYNENNSLSNLHITKFVLDSPNYEESRKYKPTFGKNVISRVNHEYSFYYKNNKVEYVKCKTTKGLVSTNKILFIEYSDKEINVYKKTVALPR